MNHFFRPSPKLSWGVPRRGVAPASFADEVPRAPEELRHGRPRAELAPPHRRGARRRPRRSPAIPAKLGNIRQTLAKFGERSHFVNGFSYILLPLLTNGTRTSSEVLQVAPQPITPGQDGARWDSQLEGYYEMKHRNNLLSTRFCGGISVDFSKFLIVDLSWHQYYQNP